MSRLESASIAHYYKISPAVTRLLAPFVSAPHGGRLFDPCTGKGAALVRLAEAWAMEPFGVELHPERAAAATSTVTHLMRSHPPSKQGSSYLSSSKMKV